MAIQAHLVELERKHKSLESELTTPSSTYQRTTCK